MGGEMNWYAGVLWIHQMGQMVVSVVDSGHSSVAWRQALIVLVTLVEQESRMLGCTHSYLWDRSSRGSPQAPAGILEMGPGLPGHMDGEGN